MMYSQPNSLKPSLDELLKIFKFSNSTPQVQGFLVKSTAPINVEDKNDQELGENVNKKFFDLSQDITLENIAKILAEAPSPEIVIRIHGYSSKEERAMEKYWEEINYINKITANCNKTFVFLAYRWPSESPSLKIGNIFRSIRDIYRALPNLLKYISGFSLAVLVTTIISLLRQSLSLGGLLTILIISGLAFSAILTLILLRISAYFRDSFRATHYAVPDLVELIRRLDQSLTQINPQKNQIKLSFIAHSMGCYVTTNTIRVLSDVFSPDDEKGEQNSNIGNAFSLGRLILVAPDIPVEAIVPRRANFLQASLKRFQESYIFTNEGDIILRLLSTAANYFSFPAKTRSSGYRLGNITVSHSNNGKKIKYGIINLASGDAPYSLLDLRSSSKRSDINPISAFAHTNAQVAQAVTNKFTYFDCTDYVDFDGNNKPVSPVGLAAQKKALNFCDYCRLVITELILKQISTHGGYFRGEFSQELIYVLACFGWDGLLSSYGSVENLSQKCREAQMQVLLSEKKIQKIKKSSHLQEHQSKQKI